MQPHEVHFLHSEILHKLTASWVNLLKSYLPVTILMMAYILIVLQQQLCDPYGLL